MIATYLKSAVTGSRLSLDTSTANGAALVCHGAAILRAANNPPKGVSPVFTRPEKYDVFEHAERAVIYSAARKGISTEGASLYCLWAACPDCARAIVSAGIREVVSLLALDVLTPPRWRDQLKVGRKILADGGVRVGFYAKKLGEKVLFDGNTLEV